MRHGRAALVALLCLLLVWRGGNPQRALQTLASFGIPVVTLDPQNIDEMELSLEILAAYSRY